MPARRAGSSFPPFGNKKIPRCARGKNVRPVSGKRHRPARRDIAIATPERSCVDAYVRDQYGARATSV
jgi:hypothetical protein